MTAADTALDTMVADQSGEPGPACVMCGDARWISELDALSGDPKSIPCPFCRPHAPETVPNNQPVGA